MKLRKHVYKSQNYHAQKKKFKLEIENCKQIIEDNKNLINNGSFTAKIHYDKMKAGQIKHFWKNDVWAVNTETKKDVSKNVLRVSLLLVWFSHHIYMYCKKLELFIFYDCV